MYYRFMNILLQKQTNVWSLDTAKAYIYEGRNGRESNRSEELFAHPRKLYYLES